MPSPLEAVAATTAFAAGDMRVTASLPSAYRVMRKMQLLGTPRRLYLIGECEESGADGSASSGPSPPSFRVLEFDRTVMAGLPLPPSSSPSPSLRQRGAPSAGPSGSAPAFAAPPSIPAGAQALAPLLTPIPHLRDVMVEHAGSYTVLTINHMIRGVYASVGLPPPPEVEAVLAAAAAAKKAEAAAAAAAAAPVATAAAETAPSRPLAPGLLSAASALEGASLPPSAPAPPTTLASNASAAERRGEGDAAQGRPSPTTAILSATGGPGALPVAPPTQQPSGALPPADAAPAPSGGFFGSIMSAFGFSAAKAPAKQANGAAAAVPAAPPSSRGAAAPAPPAPPAAAAASLANANALFSLDVVALLGTITFTRGPYLILGTRETPAATLSAHTLHALTGVEVIPIFNEAEATLAAAATVEAAWGAADAAAAAEVGRAGFSSSSSSALAAPHAPFGVGAAAAAAAAASAAASAAAATAPKSFFQRISDSLGGADPASILEGRYLSLFLQVDLTKECYFSYTYDLSRTLQSQVAVHVDTTARRRRARAHGEQSGGDIADSAAREQEGGVWRLPSPSAATAAAQGGAAAAAADTAILGASGAASPPSAAARSAAAPPVAASLPACARSHFQWNAFLTSELAEAGLSERWCPALVHGFLDQITTVAFGRTLTVTLVARRSRHFAGPRYLKRGVSDAGHVANEVETEQILEDVRVPSPLVGGGGGGAGGGGRPPPLSSSPSSSSSSSARLSSFVQVRGSVPVYWAQYGSVTAPKPPISLLPQDADFRPAKAHVAGLLERYGAPLCVLNLVRKKEKTARERLVGREFGRAVAAVNRELPAEARVQYLALDYSAISKSKKHNLVAALSDAAAWVAANTGFFACSGGSVPPRAAARRERLLQGERRLRAAVADSFLRASGGDPFAAPTVFAPARDPSEGGGLCCCGASGGGGLRRGGSCRWEQEEEVARPPSLDPPGLRFPSAWASRARLRCR